MAAPPDRREFLRSAVVGGGAMALGAALLDEGGARAEGPPAPVAAPAAPPATARVDGFELAELSIAELSQRMASGRESARSLVEKYLARIAALDRAGGSGPALRSVIEENPDALAIADALDAERKSKAKGLRGPLHGVPILLKDNIATGDRMCTTAGSLALDGFRCPRDAHVVARLRRAGAVILGKSNLSEWANIRSPRASSGWSSRGGQTRNPYVLDRSPSGSSSGSGTAVAANLCAAALGTETDGSIVSPASVANLVGIKPTVGRVSRTGIIPIAHSQDTAGPMTRTVADAALLLSVIEGEDGEDAVTSSLRGHELRDLPRLLDAGALRGARIGVPRKVFAGYHAAVDHTLEEALATLRRAGAVIVDPVDIPGLDELGGPETELLLTELKADLAAWFAWAGPASPVKSLGDVIRWNAAHADRAMPYFRQELFEQAEQKGPLDSPAYLEARKRCRMLARVEGLDHTLDRHKLDAFVAVTGAPAWVIDLIDGDNYGGGGSSTLAAVAGTPNITVPAAPWRGLPMGISFFGRAFREDLLIRYAYAFEQATHHRTPPAFLATAPLS